MNARLSLSILFLAGLLPSLGAQEAPRNPVNPALLYWQAIANLPRISDEQARDIRDMALGEKPYDPAKLGIVNIRNVGWLLRKAAASTAPCEWAIPVEEYPFIGSTGAVQMREMAQLAILEADECFRGNKTEEGMDWLLLAHRMARHTGAGKMVFSVEVQQIIEDTAIRAAARHCLGWSEAERRRYADRLANLPPLHTLQEGYRGDTTRPDWFDRTLQLEGEPRQAQIEKWVQGVVPIMLTTELSREDMQRLQVKFREQAQPETFQKAVAEYHVLVEQILLALGKPWNESDPEIKVVHDRARHSQYIWVEETIPAWDGMLDRTFTTDTLRTMLDALLQHGGSISEEDARSYHDSFEGEPLQLRKMDGGALSLLAAGQHPKGKEIELKFER